MAKNISVGDSYELKKTITDNDVLMFAEVTGDKNPLHLDDEYAKGTIFGERIAHGMISAGVISGVIGMYFPGPGTTYLSQDIRFLKPVKIGDTVTVELEINEIEAKSKFDVAKIRTVCRNQHNEIVVDGTATVIPPAEKTA